VIFTQKDWQPESLIEKLKLNILVWVFIILTSKKVVVIPVGMQKEDNFKLVSVLPFFEHSF